MAPSLREESALERLQNVDRGAVVWSRFGGRSFAFNLGNTQKGGNMPSPVVSRKKTKSKEELKMREEDSESRIPRIQNQISKSYQPRNQGNSRGQTWRHEHSKKH
jgi:hypothetical protein